MSNKWGIPIEVEKEVKERDTKCVYCGIKFSVSDDRKSNPSWEHIVNDVKINGPNNIAICCISCNASKGAKLLENWLKSEYCRKKDIRQETVADVVKKALLNPPS